VTPELERKIEDILIKVRNNALYEKDKTGLEPWDEMTIKQAIPAILQAFHQAGYEKREQLPLPPDYIRISGR
jgi:hypothetical protein